nr:hypothetical protein [Actinacidiphila oryziradicis]
MVAVEDRSPGPAYQRCIERSEAGAERGEKEVGDLVLTESSGAYELSRLLRRLKILLTDGEMFGQPGPVAAQPGVTDDRSGADVVVVGQAEKKADEAFIR